MFRPTTNNVCLIIDLLTLTNKAKSLLRNHVTYFVWYKFDISCIFLLTYKRDVNKKTVENWSI